MFERHTIPEAVEAPKTDSVLNTKEQLKEISNTLFGLSTKYPHSPLCNKFYKLSEECAKLANALSEEDKELKELEEKAIRLRLFMTGKDKSTFQNSKKRHEWIALAQQVEFKD